MSDRRKLTLPAKPDAPADQPAARRKPLRPNAPVQRQRARPAAGPEEQVTPPQEPSHTGGPERPEPRAAAPHQRPAQPQRPAKPQGPVQPPRAAQPRSQALPQHRARPAPASPTPHKLAPPVPSAARQAPEDGRVRLSKLMSEQGLASRREADDWIVQGWVRVDGEVVSELGTRVWPHQAITIDPEARAQQAQRVTILLHKPIGYVSGQAEDGYEPAVTLIRPENRWDGDTAPWQLTRGHLHKLAPAGRLDIDSTGLLVLTQDGRIARHLIGEDALVEKEYLVRVQSLAQPEAENVSAVVPEEALERLRHGLVLDDKPLKPAKVSWQNEQQLRFVLREGKKRQIRRMCEQVGLKVVGLKRVRMGQVVLGKLPVGKWRFLRPDERF